MTSSILRRTPRSFGTYWHRCRRAGPQRNARRLYDIGLLGKEPVLRSRSTTPARGSATVSTQRCPFCPTGAGQLGFRGRLKPLLLTDAQLCNWLSERYAFPVLVIYG